MALKHNPNIMTVALIAMTSLLMAFQFPLAASEVIKETGSQIIIRYHPKTGKPYTAIVTGDKSVSPSPMGEQKKYSRPDYRLLDPKVKSGQIPYDGPHRDNTKIYLFAATLAAAGAAGGALAIAFPAASTGAAAGGAGLFAGAGAAVTAGTAATVYQGTKVKPEDENFSQQSETRVIQDTQETVTQQNSTKK